MKINLISKKKNLIGKGFFKIQRRLSSMNGIEYYHDKLINLHQKKKTFEKKEMALMEYKKVREEMKNEKIESDENTYLISMNILTDMDETGEAIMVHRETKQEITKNYSNFYKWLKNIEFTKKELKELIENNKKKEEIFEKYQFLSFNYLLYDYTQHALDNLKYMDAKKNYKLKNFGIFFPLYDYYLKKQQVDKMIDLFNISEDLVPPLSFFEEISNFIFEKYEKNEKLIEENDIKLYSDIFVLSSKHLIDISDVFILPVYQTKNIHLIKLIFSFIEKYPFSTPNNLFLFIQYLETLDGKEEETKIRIENFVRLNENSKKFQQYYIDKLKNFLSQNNREEINLLLESMQQKKIKLNYISFEKILLKSKIPKEYILQLLNKIYTPSLSTVFKILKESKEMKKNDFQKLSLFCYQFVGPQYSFFKFLIVYFGTENNMIFCQYWYDKMFHFGLVDDEINRLMVFYYSKIDSNYALYFYRRLPPSPLLLIDILERSYPFSYVKYYSNLYEQQNKNETEKDEEN